MISQNLDKTPSSPNSSGYFVKGSGEPSIEETGSVVFQDCHRLAPATSTDSLSLSDASPKFELSRSAKEKIHQIQRNFMTKVNDDRLLQSHSFVSSQQLSLETSQPNFFADSKLSFIPRLPRLSEEAEPRFQSSVDETEAAREEAPPFWFVQPSAASHTFKTTKYIKDSVKLPPKVHEELSIDSPSLSQSIETTRGTVDIRPSLVLYGSTSASAFSTCGYLTASPIVYSDQSEAGLRYTPEDFPDAVAAEEYLQTSHFGNLVSLNVLRWLKGIPVATVACGYEHCLLLTREGTVMTWGSGGSGCLGQGNTLSQQFPTVVPTLMNKSVVHLEAGAYHSMALSHSGKLYAWGRGEAHQLGVPQHQLSKDAHGHIASSPIKVKFFAQNNIQLVGLACGEAHTLALDKDGTVYAFGWGEDGQLGVPSNELLNNSVTTAVQPVRALGGERVVRVAAGSLFSCALSARGQVFVWGNGEQGQLGLGPARLFEDFPKPVELTEAVVDLVCGEASVVCVTESRTVLGWGVGVAGAFGDPQTFPRGSRLACFCPQRLVGLPSRQAIVVPD